MSAEASQASVVIYTDGSCKGNPGPGGWGAWLSSGEHSKELSGGEPQTTNQRMELTAAIQALTALRKPCSVVLYTDSQYVLKGITSWISGWKRNGWQNAAKQPVKNADLWRALDAAVAPHEVDWRWVKGHSGDAGNERADALANEGAAQAIAVRVGTEQVGTGQVGAVQVGAVQVGAAQVGAVQVSGTRAAP